MQEFIDFIFFEVWCKAPKTEAFSLDLFDSKPELKEVIETFHYSDTKGADFFNGHIERIYNLFTKLTDDQIDQFKQWYRANNNIEKACANDPTIQIVRYVDIQPLYPELSNQLASFFKGLYSQNLLNLKALKEKIGDIKEHYNEFMTVNNKKICPFCGINRIFGKDHPRREAYDHYLPKGLYPFNSINFYNLVPACHHCNSSYKLSKDPLAKRRKIFYPYAAPSHKIEITINLSKPDVDALTDTDIQLIFGPSVISEELETWKDIYGIEKRYKEICCSNDAMDWLEQIRTLHDSGVKPEESLAMVRQQTEKYPFANSNFLKIAFLEGCQRIGMWT
ncbi:MAG: hypothetical protein VKL42_04435 [Snowella sp.]|nr:hypothetical protein [Snowella sp.]